MASGTSSDVIDRALADGITNAADFAIRRRRYEAVFIAPRKAAGFCRGAACRARADADRTAWSDPIRCTNG